MKKNLFSLTLVLTLSSLYAQTPNTCVNITTGYACDPSTLGFISPCQTVPFVVTNYLRVPTGYAIVGKYQWFVNGVSVKTTTDASDPQLFGVRADGFAARQSPTTREELGIANKQNNSYFR